MIKRIIPILMILISHFSYTDESHDLLNDYSKLRYNFYPCDEGNENEKRLIRYLEDFCIANGITGYSIDKIEDEDVITNSVNFIIRLDAGNDAEQNIIFFCPLNSAVIYQNYHDVSLSHNVMLNLVLQAKKNNYKKNIIFVFSGANGRENDVEFIGLKEYISGIKPERSFFIILDLFSEDSSIRFSGSYNKKPVPSQILYRYNHIKKNGLDIFSDKLDFIKSRFSIIEVDDFATYLLNKNINTISFSNRNENLSGVFYYKEELPGKLTEYFYQWLVFFDSVNFPMDMDYNYNSISLFGRNFIIPENIIIGILLAIIFLSIFLRLFMPNLQRLRLSLTLKTIPYLIFLFSIFFLFSFIPFFLFMPLELLTGMKKIYLNFQVLYFFNIFFVPQMIIFILNELLNKLPFPKHNYIYIFGAVIVSFFNLLCYLIVDISLVYIALWVLILITISNFTGKNIILKFALYILTPLPLIKLIFDLSLGHTDLLESSFQAPVVQHMIFCVSTFPFLLLMMRIRLIIRYKYRIFLSKYVYFFILVGVVAVSIFFLIVLSLAIFPGEPKINAKYFSLSNSSRLILDSNMPMGKLQLKTNGGYKTVDLKTDYKEFMTGELKKPYVITTNKTKYGMNDRYLIKLESEKDIEYMKVLLSAPYSYNPLETNLTYENITQFDKNQAADEKFEFRIPRNQGKKFDLELFLMPSDRYKIHMEINYPFFIGNEIDVRKNEGHILKYSTYIEEFKL